MGVLKKLTQIKELPTLPDVIMKVQVVANSEESDAKKLAHLIERDPSLASKILKVANSVFYGVTRKRISSIQFAIARIGFDEVLRLALASSVIEQFSMNYNTLDYVGFWRHSLAAAYLAQKIAEKSINRLGSRDELPQFYLAGLLHDIGILIYDRFFQKEFDDIVNYTLFHGVPFTEAENAVADKDSHGYVGGTLVEIWKLDPFIISAVRHHHEAHRAPEKYKHIASVLTVVEHILSTTKMRSVEGLLPEPEKSIFEFLGISEDDYPKLVSYTEKELLKCDALLGQPKTSQLSYV